MAWAIVKAARNALAPIFSSAPDTILGIQPADWASPVQPIRVVRQTGVGVRNWDFTPGINLQFTPRGDVPVSFGQLYRVSNSFDLCRLMIETRKDQVVNRPWTIRVKAKAGEQKKDRAARQANDPDVAFLSDLFTKPDGVHTFDLWIRMWLEQLLVFDAPCIFPVRNVLGDIIPPMGGIPGGFRVISGATITPLVDNDGFRPFPPNPAFQQIILGLPVGNLATGGTGADKAREFTANQLLYSPRNPRVDSRWGFSPVEQIIVTLSIASNRQQFLRDYYVAGNVPEGLLPMPESWTMQQIKDFQTWFDSMLAGNLARKRRMIMIPATEKGAQFSKDKALTDATDDYLTRVVAFAFSVTPQNLIKQVNRGTAKESTDVAQIEGLEPVLKHIENVMNDCVQIARPGSQCEFAYQDEREMDPVKQAQVDEIYINTGTYTRNEVREARGDDTRPEPGADALTVTYSAGVIALDDAIDQGANPPEPDPEPSPGGDKGPAGKFRKRSALKIAAGDLTPKSRQARQEAVRILTRFLKDQGKRVAKQAAGELKKSRKVRKDETTESDTDRALAILAMLQFDYPTLYKALQPYLEIAAEEGAKAGAYQQAANLGTPLTETIATAVAQARKAADERAAELAGLNVEDDGTIAEATSPHWAISTTAGDDVLAAIKQAIVENWTPEQLEAVIQASTVFSADHAEMTAENEVEAQQMNGHVLSWVATGAVLEWAWIVQYMCCPLCASFAEQGSVPVGHEFAPGIYRPLAHPHCRCMLKATKFKGED